MKKILIVDDDADFARTVSDFLESKEYLVFTAQNGIEAVDFLMKETVDLILLDIVMPDFNGFEVTSFLKNEIADTPIIVVSAHTHNKYRLIATEIGADHFMSKPLSFPELEQAIHSCLQK